MQLGRYTVLGRLAVGGMAEVLLGQLDGTSGFERKVVIKRVLPQYVNDAEFSRLFQQEARFASFLVHPNIAQVIDFGVADGTPYLVMEYVDGASLKKLLSVAKAQNERPDVRLVCRIFSQVADALGAVHATLDPQTKLPLSLVHRDVSPDNVLLSRQGAVKLADFGIARAMSEVSTTKPDTVRGKLRYMAPEQLLGLELSPAVDVWALGVSLYEALALRRPFSEDNDGATTYGIVNHKFPLLDTVRPDLPADLVTLVHRCMSPEPGARYASAHDLARALERLAGTDGSAVTATVIGNWVDRLAPPQPLDRLHAIDGPASSSTQLPPAPAPPLDQRPPVAAPPAPAPSEPPPGLELTPPDAPAPQAPPEPRATRWGLLAGVALLFVLAGGVTFGRRWLNPPVTQRQVLITSTPNGAVVRQGGRTLGSTPWAGDLPLTEIELTLDAPGYRTKKVQLTPNDLKLNVELQRR